MTTNSNGSPLSVVDNDKANPTAKRYGDAAMGTMDEYGPDLTTLPGAAITKAADAKPISSPNPANVKCLTIDQTSNR